MGKGTLSWRRDAVGEETHSQGGSILSGKRHLVREKASSLRGSSVFSGRKHALKGRHPL